jgi:subtilisin family serine protease
MIEAINWLIEEHVKVINMSLAGPDNAILKAVVNAANKQGAFIVAAAGNEGPAAAAVFPAGYQDVIAVSAIDQHQQPYRWSNQGTYIDYSAFGVNVLTAQSQRRTGRESGTSMAAPVVSAALACIVARRQNAAENRSDVLSALAEKAIDLGPTGKDRIHVWSVLPGPFPPVSNYKTPFIKFFQKIGNKSIFDPLSKCHSKQTRGNLK